MLHLCHGMLLALAYLKLEPNRQRHILKSWSSQLVDLLQIRIQIEGQVPETGTAGCLLVANHVSWLDIFVLNSIQPARFVAKSEVRGWPVIGWLCERGGTIFIERATRQNAAAVNRTVSGFLQKGDCVGLFPEGTTTDGHQVGHFHSSLIQPAIDARVTLHPVALRYRNERGELDTAAAFTGDTTLFQSIWSILRCQQLNVLVVFTPALTPEGANRRTLARASQEAVAWVLRAAGSSEHAHTYQQSPPFPCALLASQSAYSVLIDPLLRHPHK